MSANARLSCAAFAVWLIANSTTFAQTAQGAAQPVLTPGYTVARTIDGKPDISGQWSNAAAH